MIIENEKRCEDNAQHAAQAELRNARTDTLQAEHHLDRKAGSWYREWEMWRYAQHTAQAELRDTRTDPFQAKHHLEKKAGSWYRKREV